MSGGQVLASTAKSMTVLALATRLTALAACLLVSFCASQSETGPATQMMAPDAVAITAVDPTALSELITSADRIVVYKSEMAGAPIQYESNKPEDIVQFNRALTIGPPRPGEHIFCTCIAAPIVRLYRQGQPIVEIRMFGGTSIGIATWDSDGVIADPNRWMQWFDARNVPGPRAEFEDDKRQAAATKVAYDRWIAAMPESIRPLWPRSPGLDVNQPLMLQTLSKALSNQVPDRQQRARILFGWFGSGLGPWSGFPSYEEVGEKLLLELPTQDLIAAAESGDLTEAQNEGAARLFGGWAFSHQRLQDTGKLPTDLKRRLLEHVTATADRRDADKYKRAMAAFGTN